MTTTQQTFPIQTKFGPLTLHVCDDNRVYVSTKELNVGPLITVRNIIMYASVHLTKQQDGDSWFVTDKPKYTWYNHVYLSRYDNGNISNKMKETVATEVERCVNEWYRSQEAKDALKQAGIEKLVEKHENKVKEIKELQRQINMINEELEEVVREIERRKQLN